MKASDLEAENDGNSACDALARRAVIAPFNSSILYKLNKYKSRFIKWHTGDGCSAVEHRPVVLKLMKNGARQGHEIGAARHHQLIEEMYISIISNAPRYRERRAEEMRVGDEQRGRHGERGMTTSGLQCVAIPGHAASK